MHYLTDKVKNLPEDERRKVYDEIFSVATVPETTIDQFTMTLMTDHIDAAIERFDNFGKMQGLTSGYPSVDRLTKGFVPGELTIIAGKTSKGKTTLAINIANKLALLGYKILFVTLEMTHVEITSRFMFLNGGNTENFAQVAASIVFQDTQELNWKSIKGLIAQAKLQIGADLVVIDHLHYFSREIEGVAEDLGRITKEFKAAAQTHNIPLLLISHVRKTQNNKEATMDDLRSSSFIAQDADIVLMVGRAEGKSNELHVRIEKNRNRGFDYDDNKAVLSFDRTVLEEIKPKEHHTPWNT